MKRFAKFEMLREAEIAFSPFPARKHCSDLSEIKKTHASVKKKNKFSPEVSTILGYSDPTSDPDSHAIHAGNYSPEQQADAVSEAQSGRVLTH